MTEQFNKEEYDKQYEQCLLETYKKDDGDTDYNRWAYDCIEDENYPFTFKNKCYDKCPDGTYLSNEE